MQGYKTFIVSLLLTIFGALEAFDFTQFVGADNAGYIIVANGVIMYVLRRMTNTPIFNK